MPLKTNDPLDRLRQVWEEEIRLLTRIQRGQTAPSEQAPFNLTETLAEILSLQEVAKELQDLCEQCGASHRAEMTRIKERKREALNDAIQWVRKAEQKINVQKQEVIEQLAEVNRAQTGYERYRNR